MKHLHIVIVFFFGVMISKCETIPKESLSMSKSPKEECEDLMNELVSFAEQMLQKNGEFFPFGGTISRNGTIAHSSAYDGREQPPSQELINLMTKGFQQSASRGEIKACAIVSDIRIVPPGSKEKTDAIRVQLDHIEDYSVEVIFPYQLSESKELIFGDLFAQAGLNLIFTKQQENPQQKD